ncbi:MAG: adenosylcobinamide-phosphate synthase CbiB [Clostridiales bacterium]|nr:adenosylcobinamide-phosphate synthase CbiB [Clostridiales bacterium]
MFGFYSLFALAAGFLTDLVIGDPHWLPHPVVLMGKLISLLEKLLRRVFPKTKRGENVAGLVLWLVVSALAFLVPAAILMLCYHISKWLGFAVESVMCWQCLAAKSLRDESMKVKKALDSGDISASRRAVSMIVGRDTDALDEKGVARAAVETVAENTSDGVIAPLMFLAIGGGPLGMLYKAVNTMDSMLGYVEPPYRYFGLIPAKADDVFNFIPARISAIVMLLAGGVTGFDMKNGRRIFRRDRYKHASPNSAQTESVMAGLLRLRLAGDAYYHGVLHKKDFIGDALREIEPDDIRRSNVIMYLTALFALLIFGGARLAVLFLIHAVL